MDTHRLLDQLANQAPYQVAGRVLKSVGLIFEAIVPNAVVGSVCRILTNDTKGVKPIRLSRNVSDLPGVDAEVIGFRDKRVVLMPFGDAQGVGHDSLVVLKQTSPDYWFGESLLGRVLDATGAPIDGKGPIDWEKDTSALRKSLYQVPSHPLERSIIEEPLDLGVRAINGLLSIGRGQRVGIMAGSGVGKSVLLGMMGRNTAADVNVIALIGERGREVREFIENDLGEEGLKRSVVIVATSDKSPLLRMRGAVFASAVAEYFRDTLHKDVLLLMDSITRFCMAQREIGLSLGEPPASKGYPPSVFSTLPKVLERAGTGISGGSITGLYTVLVEGDDMDDPIADATRSILDGHIVLSRKIAQKNHFPAIDVLASTSRVMKSVTDESHQDWAGKIKEWIALYNQAEDLINIGAYAKGSNAKIDQSIFVNERLQQFLKQKTNETGDWNSSLAQMQAIVRSVEGFAQSQQAGKK